MHLQLLATIPTTKLQQAVMVCAQLVLWKKLFFHLQISQVILEIVHYLLKP
jgi:hypothetical protein